MTTTPTNHHLSTNGHSSARSAAALEEELTRIREQERAAKERSVWLEQQLQVVKHQEWQARAAARHQEHTTLEEELAALENQLNQIQAQLAQTEQALSEAGQTLVEIRASLLAPPPAVEVAEEPA
jgi:chromosome segregation ATPase